MWLQWRDNKFTNATCPWENPREMRKREHRPKDSAIQAVLNGE